MCIRGCYNNNAHKRAQQQQMPISGSTCMQQLVRLALIAFRAAPVKVITCEQTNTYLRAKKALGKRLLSVKIKIFQPQIACRPRCWCLNCMQTAVAVMKIKLSICVCMHVAYLKHLHTPTIAISCDNNRYCRRKHNTLFTVNITRTTFDHYPLSWNVLTDIMKAITIFIVVMTSNITITSSNHYNLFIVS